MEIVYIVVNSYNLYNKQNMDNIVFYDVCIIFTVHYRTMICMHRYYRTCVMRERIMYINVVIFITHINNYVFNILV
jgi:hypothetical protein